MTTTKEMNVKNVNFESFEDQFGNLLREFEIIRYDKRSDDQWVEEQRYESGRSYYVIEDQIYWRLDNSLIKMNMDFNSENCDACYSVGNEIKNIRKITGNYALITVQYPKGTLTLQKQTYSNNTCFYSLEDSRGQFEVNHASSDINDIVKVLEHENKIYKNYLNTSDGNESMEIVINNNNKIISYIKENRI